MIHKRSETTHVLMCHDGRSESRPGKFLADSWGEPVSKCFQPARILAMSGRLSEALESAKEAAAINFRDDEYRFCIKTVTTEYYFEDGRTGVDS